MCQFASFFHNPLNGDVAIHDLNSHGNTEKKLKLNLNIWREGHYLPDNTFELRFCDTDKVDKIECQERFKNRFPSFISFLNWAFREKEFLIGDSLDLNSLTSVEKAELRKKYPNISIP